MSLLPTSRAAKIAKSCMTQFQQAIRTIQSLPGSGNNFCISCAWVVENPVAHSSRFFKSCRVFRELPSLREKEGDSRPHKQLREEQKISGKIFLNCTKNIELTRARFARTFSFALAKN